MPTETQIAESETQLEEFPAQVSPANCTRTQTADAREIWVREIMLPHFGAGGVEESFASAAVPPSSLPGNKSANLHEALASDKARHSRRRCLIVPREHGGWGLLLVPMITGAGVGFRQNLHAIPFLLLLTSALALFWLRTPVESLLGTSAMRAQTEDERRTVTRVILVLSAVAASALTGLLWAGRNPYLWLIGATAAAAFIGQGLLRKFSRHRMLAEVIGTIGLTTSAPAAFYVITGKLDATSWILWVANLVFAGNQIHFVQLRIHAAKLEGMRAKLSRGWWFAVGQAAQTIALTIAGVGSLLPPLALLAFAPILFRGWFYFIQPPAPLRVRRLGWTELAHALAFCVLLIATI